MIRTLLLLLTLSLVPAVGLSAQLRVFASVAPIQSFVERVGGQNVEAGTMVRPGFSPHTYDPAPQQISALAGAVLYVRTGVPFEDVWMDRIRSANPEMQVLDVRDGISVRTLTDEPDAYVWSSPPLVGHMADVIRDTLSMLDPAHKADFAHNRDAFVAELDALDRELRALLNPLPNRKFMVFHPAWGYFADTYGLIQVPIEHEGEAHQVAQAIGGTVIAVDPLAADYVENLRRVGHAFAQALQP